MELTQIDEINSASKENYAEICLEEYVFSSNMTSSASKTIFFTPDLSKPRAFNDLSLYTIQVAEIKPTRKVNARKSVSEEFFYLTTQSIKMSSPFIDIICSISTRELYQKVQQENIPFHNVRTMQWHTWLVERLSAEQQESTLR